MGKIAVVGSINVDMTVKTQRIPRKGETLSGYDLQYIPGGKGANQAAAMAKLGADVVMFGCVGDDAYGDMVLQNLESCGICTDFVQKVEHAPTGIAVITVGENDNTIVVVSGANAHVTKDYIDSIKTALLQSELVLLQHEIPQETVEYVIHLCAENNIRTILNPAPARAVSREVLEKVSYLTPNEHEERILFKDQDVHEVLQAYAGKLVVTQGEKGVSASLPDGTILSVPGRKAKVVDTTGAGDTLNGAFAVQLAEGAEMKEALLFANVAASLSTEKFGAQGGMPSRQDVEKELKKMMEERGK